MIEFILQFVLCEPSGDLSIDEEEEQENNKLSEQTDLECS